MSLWLGSHSLINSVLVYEPAATPQSDKLTGRL
jgi:hypothetical protein